MKKPSKKLPFLLLLASLSVGITARGAATDLQAQTKEAKKPFTAETHIISTTNDVISNTLKEPISDQAYEPFGLVYDQSKKELYFKGELVRYFYDGVDLIDNGKSIYWEFLNEKGKVDIYATREAILNADGSTDSFGKLLLSIERYSQDEFNKRDLSHFYGSFNTTVVDMGGFDPTVAGFDDRFEKYKEFGIEYKESKTASGAGNVYYNGELVNMFLDMEPDGGIFSFHSAERSNLNVQTVYNTDGKLTGINKMTK